jgi:hypothetical protein
MKKKKNSIPQYHTTLAWVLGGPWVIFDHSFGFLVYNSLLEKKSGPNQMLGTVCIEYYMTPIYYNGQFGCNQLA